MTETARKIADNLHRVMERVEKAASAAGRDPKSVKVIGVTKYVDPDLAGMLFHAGCHRLGESRPQVLLEKVTALAELKAEWHFIGHLQRNKVKKILPHVNLIHSLDSLRLAESVNRLASEQALPIDALLEVNISGDEAKHGFLPQQIPAVLTAIHELAHVRVTGLMGMAGLKSTAKEVRGQFCRLRELRDSLQPTVQDGVPITELSMGMSGDFELAIAEGATMVRIGSMLFEGVL